MKNNLMIVLLIMNLITIDYQYSSAQLNIGGTPYSFNNSLSKKKVVVMTMPSFDLVQIEAEDEEDELEGKPPRFGYLIKAGYNLENSGQWETLDSGDRIWRLSIFCEGAKSINLLYDAFWLPQGATLYIYNEDKTHVLGGFTSQNNNSPKGKSVGFGTGLVYGDKITLEYFEPKDSEKGEISIAQVVHGYRYINVENQEEAFGDSGTCQVNVNCSEGNNWQSEKNSVALILVGGNRWCTGSLLITTAKDLTPYFLTANHCLSGWAISTPLDAESNRIASNWSFYWNYESPTCTTPASEPAILSTTGAILVSNRSNSDFALFRLVENPNDNYQINPWFNGWNASLNTPGAGGVGIHHPSGDIKKISTHSMVPTSSNSFWEINWDPTNNGYSVTEGGSSGSPLFDNNKRVIGQLLGGSSVNCSDPANDYALYGKFSESWKGDKNIRRSLYKFLDPICPSNYTVPSAIVDDARNYYTSNTLTSNKKVLGYSYVEFKAKNKITLNPGFKVGIGARFEAKPGGCVSSGNIPGGTVVLQFKEEDPGALSEKENETLEIKESTSEKSTNTSLNQPIIEQFMSFPNPVKDQTTLRFSLEEDSEVTITLIDTHGKPVRKLLSNVSKEKGTHELPLNLSDLPNGHYFCTLLTPTDRKVLKITLLK